MSLLGRPAGDERRRNHESVTYDPSDDPAHVSIGPIVHAIGVAYLLVAPVIFMGAYPVKPSILTLLSLLPIGALLLIPRQSLLSLRFSLVLVAYVAWAIASIGWSESPDSSLFLVRTTLLAVVAMSLVASFLPTDSVTVMLARSMQAIIVVTLFAILTSSAARSTFGQGGITLPGWRGYFPHKNVMSPVVTLAVVTILAFEPNRRVAFAFVVAGAGLLIPSQSATGVIALALGLSAWYWTGIMARADPRQRSTSRVIASALFLLTLAFAVRSTSLWLDAFGKDITFTGRTEIWAATWPYIADRPVQGYGLAGPFGNLGNPIALDIFRSVGFFALHAHNGFVDLMATLGIVGVVIVGILIGGSVKDAWRLIDVHPGLSRWVLTMIFVLLFVSFTENVFSTQFVAVIGAARILLIRQRAGADRSLRNRDHRLGLVGSS